MRCHASIWRWSPFFGIWASNETGASGCTTYGANRLSSTLIFFSFSASQCASSPSPSEETMPMPVIQTSLAPADLCSVMRYRLQWEADLVGLRVHVHAQGRVREGGKAEGEFSAALQLLADAYLGLGDGKAGAFVLELRIDRQQLTGTDVTPHLGLLHDGQERHALHFQDAEYQPAGTLRHRFGQQHAGHDRETRKMPFEDGMRRRNLSLDRNFLLVEIEVDDAIDQLEVIKVHGGRLKRFPAKWRPVRVKKTRQTKNLEPRSDLIGTEMALGARRCILGGDQFVNAIGEILQHEILLGRGLAVVDLLGPFFERHLDPERLVDGKGDVEEVQAVDSQIVDGVALRLDRVARNVAGLRDNVGDLIECRRHH